MKLKGGVLIIGSLFWQDGLDDNPFLRKNWKNRRLSIKKRFHILAPIRYGRLSNKKKTYTMVLSKEIEEQRKFGTAYILPFKNDNINSLIGVKNQARYLSKAEGDNQGKVVMGNWGVIGILFNPTINSELKNRILEYWNNQIQKDGGFDPNDYRIFPEEPILNRNGEILTSWIRTVDPNLQREMDEFDFILATCTKPNIPNYPTATELRENIKNDPRKYFYNNITNGITTFCDRDVINQA